MAAVPIQGSTPSWSIADAGDWSASAPAAPATGVVGEAAPVAAPANDWGGGAATEDWSK